ncbi:hypothetical protein KBY70_05540 [Cyanobium sp. ATX 6E8]|uniref:hypothetical protein n=1 Tax=Cyanobium sp. ATX 6E8 TaxID=2823701 RepID=UPI0020CDC7D8|nr:hypothetical protein [Cyanobium sp. ATX 6E8]MCP9941850.1 hypothetical protein [Cyanobium sp. ATX 6E8]
MRLTRADISRLRNRHRGYLITLAVEVALLLLLPLAQDHLWLLSAMLILLALVLMVFVSRYSPLRKTRPLIYGLGGLAIALEVVWHVALNGMPLLGRALTIPHVIVWLVFLLLAVIRKVKTLIREPFVTVSVVMGAASGYLLVGLAGGLLLTALWVLHPATFDLTSLPPVLPSSGANVAVAPALMAASFTMLTTIGTTVLKTSHVAGQVVTTVITVVGQLYVAILIGLILGRFRWRA